MAFILRKDRVNNSLEEWNRGWAAYSVYLESIRERLQKGAYEFAIATWHYNFEDHRSPHDGWLESVIIQKLGQGERSKQISIDIRIHLLGAYHDGYIEISYNNVKSYILTAPFKENGLHGDWLYDEIRLSDRGYCLHEIEWSEGSSWLIESSDIIYRWNPFDQAAK